MAKGNSVKIRIDGDASDLERKLKNIGNTAKAGLADVKAGVDMATAAIGKLASVAEKGIAYNATIEQLKTSFEVMTGSAEKAVDVVERLRVMGAETPFETADLAKTTQLLMQYGFNADEAIDRMRMLGDVAQGNTAAMNSIALGYAQMASAGKVSLVDLKQMISAGFNPLQEISERTGESMASLYDRISKGTMTVDEITESMRRATGEGGRFYQSMEKQSQTLNGQLSTLKDNADQLLGSLTEGISDGLRDQMLPFANNLVAELQEAFDTGGYQGLVDTATDMIPDLLGMMTGELQKGIEGLTRWLPQGASKLMQALPGALRMATTVTPQITQALFETANYVINDLVSMLPELTPTILKGIGDMMATIGTGILKTTAVTIGSIAALVKKDAGEVWAGLYDQEQVSEFTAKVSGNVDIGEAKTAIETAYAELNAALNSDLLKPGEVAQITELIGSDYDTIYAKLKSFGLSDDDAGALASKVTESSEKVIAELNKLNIEADGSTVARWIAQAGLSRIRLKAALKKSGLSPEDQNEIIKVFTDMTDNINGQLPDVIGEIYATLTDGKAANDDKKSLKSLLDEAFKTDIAEVDEWLNSNIGELDTESATYAADVAALTQEAAAYKAEITTLQAEMVALVESLAGQPTAVVEARMGEFEAIEARLAEINAYIKETTAEAQSAYEQAYRRVRAGATTEETDIADALSYAYTNYKLNQQEIEDAAKAAKAEADAAWDKGLKSEEERKAHLAALEQIEKDRTAELEALQQSYAKQLSDLMQGLGKAFAVTDPETMSMLGDLADKIDIVRQIEDILANWDSENAAAIEEAKAKVKALMEALTGEEVMPSNLQFNNIEGFVDNFQDQLAKELGKIEATAEDGTNPIIAAFEGIFQSDAFAAIEFDTSSLESKITAALNGVVVDAAKAASPAANDAGADLLDSVADGGAKSGSVATGLGNDYGSGYVSGVEAYEDEAYSAGYKLGKATARGTAAGQNSASPSKVAIALGNDFGEGYTIGLQESMSRAANVAKVLTGHVVTSATLTQSMRVNIPTLTQDIILANEQSDRSVSLYVNGKELGRVMAADNQLAQNRYNRSIAMGVGKK